MDNVNLPQLLPCPFCARMPSVSSESVIGFIRFTIRCDFCRYSFTDSLFEVDPADVFSKVSRRWNRRAVLSYGSGVAQDG